jgi:HD-GYP domain-containing protein (c-di-GMP phosphodiesterase class II)
MKRLLKTQPELIVVLSSLAVFALVKLVLANKFAFLNLYFIPVLIAGYYLGKRPAILSSIVSVLLTALFVIRWPHELLQESQSALYMGLNLLVWASFLILVGLMVSTLNENRQRRLALATHEVLEKYLRQSIEGPQSHQVRVAALAKAIAKEMRLGPEFVSSIEAAALLHDLGESENGYDLLADSSRLGPASRDTIIGTALPIIVAKTDSLGRKRGAVTIGAKILAVADAFDELLNHKKDPMAAAEEMDAANDYDKSATGALIRVLRQQKLSFA